MNWREALKKSLRDVEWPEIAPGQTGAASVLIPMGFNQKTGTEEILLTKRTSFLMHHKGQVSFPGGFREREDVDLRQTALRESEEEIGLKPADVEILGRLPPTATLRKVYIYPWVGWMTFPYSFEPNPGEVDRIIYLSIPHLMKTGLKPVDVPGHAPGEFVGIETEGELVWGATGKILLDLYKRLLMIHPSSGQKIKK